MELKRRDCARVLTEIVEFIALPFPFPSKPKIWSFLVVGIQGLQKKCTKKYSGTQGSGIKLGFPILIHYIVIYPMDSAIQCLKNPGLLFYSIKSFKVTL